MNDDMQSRIDELLTIDKFVFWLSKLSDEDTFVPNLPRQCPIHAYLMDNLENNDLTAVYYSCIFVGTIEYKIPEWATSFQRNGVYDFYKMNRNDCLVVCESIINGTCEF